MVFVGGVPLEETVHFYRAADVFVYPSLNETFGLPILEAMACGCPVVTSNVSAMPETAGGAAVLADPKDPASIARAIVEAAEPARDRLHRPWVRARGAVHLGRDRRGHPGRLPRGRGEAKGAQEMKILVTGGAGFIGSHTCDRLLASGMTSLCSTRSPQPVHRDGRPPAYLSSEIDFYQGDVRNRDLLANLLRRVDAVYHFAAYQDYLPDFARFSDVNVVSTALIYEIIVAERLDIARVVVASSQSAMGEGLYRCPADGDQLPGMRPENALAGGQWDIPCPQCGGPLEMRATPEHISNPQNAYGMSKLGEEMVAINLGRRYGIPTVALRYSIVQGPRQSVYNAYSGACRIFCLSYLQGSRADRVRGRRGDSRLREHRRRGGRQRPRAGRRPGRRPGIQRGRRHGGHDQGVRRHRHAPVRIRTTGHDHWRVPLRRHPAHPVRHQRAAEARLGTPADAGRLGRAYAAWLEGIAGLDGVLAQANAQMRALGVVRKAAE